VAAEIDASINGAATVLPHVSPAGVRALGISTKKRSSLAPDLPTIDEAGVPGYSSQGAFGLLAPVAVPQDIRDKIETDLADVMRRPEIRNILGAFLDDHLPEFCRAERRKLEMPRAPSLRTRGSKAIDGTIRLGIRVDDEELVVVTVLGLLDRIPQQSPGVESSCAVNEGPRRAGPGSAPFRCLKGRHRGFERLRFVGRVRMR
jgi:hypothetical protein